VHTFEAQLYPVAPEAIAAGAARRHELVRDAARRDRLLLLVAIAHTLLTLLGAAAEEAGLDSYLKANIVKRRTHSLYRQGLYWYHCIATMREEWLVPLMRAFDRIVREHAFFGQVFAMQGLPQEASN